MENAKDPAHDLVHDSPDDLHTWYIDPRSPKIHIYEIDFPRESLGQRTARETQNEEEERAKAQRATESTKHHRQRENQPM